MKRYLKLEKYIKRYTGINLKVYTIKYHHGGYGAYQKYYLKGYMTINEDLVDFKPLIWHEMGHLMTHDDDWIKAEYKAQKWALNKLKKLKYNRIYKRSIEWIKRWNKIENENTIKYGIVKKMLLN